MHMHLICNGTCIVHCPRQAYNINREIEKILFNQRISQLAVHRQNSVQLSRDQSQVQAAQLRVVRDFFSQSNYEYLANGSSLLTSHGQYFDRRDPYSSAFEQNVEHPFSAHWQDRPQSYRQQSVGQFQGHVSDRDRFYGQSTTYNERPVLEQTYQQRSEFDQTRQFPFNREASPQYNFEQRLHQSTYEQAFESQRYPYHHSRQIFPQQDMTQRFLMLNYGQTHPQLEFGWTHPHANIGQRDLGERQPQQYLRHHLLQPDIAQNHHFEHRYSQQFMGERQPYPEFPQQNFEQRLQQRDLWNRQQLSAPAQHFSLLDFEPRRSYSNFDQTFAQSNYGPRLAQPNLQQLITQPDVVQPNVRPTPGQINLMRLLTQPTQSTLPDQPPLIDTSLLHRDIEQIMNQSNFEQIMPQSYFGQHAPQNDFNQSELNLSERPDFEQIPENISYRQASLNAGSVPSQLPNQNLQHPFNSHTPQETVFQAPENREGPQPIHSQNFEQINHEDSQQPICGPSAGPFGERILQKPGYEPLQQPIYPLGSYAYNTHTFTQNEELFRADGSQLFGSVSSKEPNDAETVPIAQPITESVRPSNVQTHEESQKIQRIKSLVGDSRRPQSSSSNHLNYENSKESQTPRPVSGQDSKEARPNELIPVPLDTFGPVYPEQNKPLRPVTFAAQTSERPDESLSPNNYQTLTTVPFCDLIPTDPDSVDHNGHRQVGYHSPVFSEEARHSGHNRPISSVSIVTLSSESSNESSSTRHFKALCLGTVNGQGPKEDTAKSYETVEPSKSNHTPSPGSDSNSHIHPDEHQPSGLIGTTLSPESIVDQSPERSDESSSPDVYRVLNTVSSSGQRQIEQENLNHNQFGLFSCHSPVLSEEARTSWPTRPLSSVCIDNQISERSDAPSSPRFFQRLRLLPVSDESLKEPYPNNEPSPDNLGRNSSINHDDESQRLGYIRQTSPVLIVDQSPERSDQSLSPKIYQTLDLMQFGFQSPKKLDKTISPHTSRAISPEPGRHGPQEPEALIQQISVFSEPQQVVDEQLDSEHDDIKCNLI